MNSDILDREKVEALADRATWSIDPGESGIDLYERDMLLGHDAALRKRVRELEKDRLHLLDALNKALWDASYIHNTHGLIWRCDGCHAWEAGGPGNIDHRPDCPISIELRMREKVPLETLRRLDQEET